MMPALTTEESEQYSRHLRLPQFGAHGQEKLRNASVLIVGAGGLGCPAAQYLTAAGFGKIGIIDDDCVELSNLQRQILFSHDDLGKPKVVVAAEKLSRLNPYVEIVPHRERLENHNAESILSGYDLVLDGSDNFHTKYLVNDACVILDRPLVHGSIHMFEGMVSVFNFQNGPTYRCLFPDPPDASESPNCSTIGVLGVLPGIIGSWQALEAIKVVSGIGVPLSGKVMIYHALTQKVQFVSLQLDLSNRSIESLPDSFAPCPLASQGNFSSDRIEPFHEISCEGFRQMRAENPKLQVLDVREPWERAQCSILPSLHLPLGELLAIPLHEKIECLSPDEDLIVYCKAGVRSRRACEFLHSAGFNQLFNLSGGIDHWSVLQSCGDAGH